MVIPSVFAPLFVPTFPLYMRNSALIFLRRVCGPIPQLGAVPIHWIWSLQILSPLCWVFWLMSFLLCPGKGLGPWHQGLSSGYCQFPLPHCYTTPFKFLTLCTSPSTPVCDPASLFPPPPLSLYFYSKRLFSSPF